MVNRQCPCSYFNNILLEFIVIIITFCPIRMNEIVTNRVFMYEATSAILGIMMSQNNETVGAPKQSCRG